MDIYIDESGDLGFSNKSTNFFIAAYVIPQKSMVINESMRKILQKMHKHKKYSGSEIKFSNANHENRLYLLRKISELNWEAGVIVLEKKKVSHSLKDKPNILYNYCIVHNVIRNILVKLDPSDSIQLNIDRSLSESNREGFNTYARDKASWIWDIELGRTPPLNYGQIRVSHKNSLNEPCIQLADLVAGSTFQKYERLIDDYYRLIEPKISSFIYLW